MFVYPHHYYFVRVMINIGSAYFIVLACIRAAHDRRARRAAAAELTPSSAEAG
jgi:hypothetical protein